MAAINGLTTPIIAQPPISGPTNSGAAGTAGGPAGVMNNLTTTYISGVPVKIVIIAIAAAAGLTVLKMAGFRFNVGVSS